MSQTRLRHKLCSAVEDRRMDLGHDEAITTQDNNDRVHIVLATRSWEIYFELRISKHQYTIMDCEKWVVMGMRQK